MHAVRHAVRRRVVAAVAVGPLIGVDGVHRRRAATCGHDGQHARAAAHIQPAAPFDAQIEQRRHHEIRGGVVARAERQAGHDDHLGHPLRRRCVVGRTDSEPPLDLHGREAALPRRIPIFGAECEVAAAHRSAAVEHGIDRRLAFVERLLRDVRLERTVLREKALEGVIGQLRRQDFGLQSIGNGDIQLHVVHNYVKLP